MSEASRVVCGLPFCQNAEIANENQTKLSISLRITAVALGSIAMLIGILVLCNIRGLSQLGAIGGWITFATGTCFVALGLAIKSVQRQSDEIPTTIKQHLLQKNRESVVRADLSQPTIITRPGLSQPTITDPIVEDHVEKPEPQPPEHPTELARKEVIEWFSQEGSLLGEGQYEAVIAKTKQIAETLPHEEMTLHRHWFRWDFTFFFAEKSGEEKYIPIPFKDGAIMNWQAKKEGGSAWPIFDTQKNDYVAPKVTVIDTPPPSGSMPTSQYIRAILSTAQYQKESKEYRILEALIPYAEWLQRDCGDATYDKIRELIPAYPKLPPRQKQILLF